jgi:hypothetical protein
VLQPQQRVAGQRARQGPGQVGAHHLEARRVEGVQAAHEGEAKLDGGDGPLG